MLYLFVNLLSWWFTPATSTNLTVEISNIQHAHGTVRIGVFKAHSTFGSTYTVPDFGQVVSVHSKKPHLTSLQLPPGQYALALYHDLNDNVKLDLNFIGYPKEPFGFSNNYRPIFRGPRFKECAFEVKHDGRTVVKINLID